MTPLHSHRRSLYATSGISGIGLHPRGPRRSSGYRHEDELNQLTLNSSKPVRILLRQVMETYKSPQERHRFSLSGPRRSSHGPASYRRKSSAGNKRLSFMIRGSATGSTPFGSHRIVHNTTPISSPADTSSEEPTPNVSKH